MSWLTDNKRKAARIAKRNESAKTTEAIKAERERIYNLPENVAKREAERLQKLEDVKEGIYKFKKRKAQAERVAAETQARIDSGELVLPVYAHNSLPLKDGMSFFKRAALKKLKARIKRGDCSLNEFITLTEKLTAGTYTWTWTSSNSAVASVAKTGTDTATQSQATVTGVSVGSANVIATLNDMGPDGTTPETLTGSCVVTVTASTEKAHLSSITSVTFPNGVNCVAGTAFDSGVPVVVCDSPVDGSYTYSWGSYSMSGIGGLSVNTSTGEVTGTPSQAGSGQMFVKVTDSYKNSLTKYITFTATAAPVEKAHISTVTSSVSPSTATVGTAYTGQLSNVCNSADDGSYTYVYGYNGPTSHGLVINTSTGAISGTPTTDTTAGFKCTVTDSYNHSVTGYANVAISAAANPAVLSKMTRSPLGGYTNVKQSSTSSYVFTLTFEEPDDGTYDIAMNWQGSDPTGGASQGSVPFTVQSDGTATATITGPFTKAGNFFIMGTVTDTAGHSQTIPASTWELGTIA